MQWASQPSLSVGGFPVANIISTGLTTEQGGSKGALCDLAHLIATAGLKDEHLVVAEMDSMFDPNFNLQRIVEHSLVRGKDTVTYFHPPPGEPLDTYTSVTFQGDDAVNPKLQSIDPRGTAGCTADGRTTAVLTPIYFFRRTTLPDILEAASTSPAADRQVECFLESLMSAGRPLYGLPLEFGLGVRTLGQYLFAASYYAYVGKKMSEGGHVGEAQQALEEVTRMAVTAGVQIKTEAELQYSKMVEASSVAKQLMMRFR